MKIRLKNLFLLILCLIRFLIYGRADKIKKPRNVLIVQTAKLGDMVCTTPLFKAFNKNGYKVFVMGNSANKELLRDNSDVNDYLIYDGKNLIKTIKFIKRLNLDCACLTVPNFTALAVLFLSGISAIVIPEIKNGVSPYENRSYKILRRFCIKVPHNMGQYAPREYLRLLEPFGIFTDDTKKTLDYSSEAGERISRFLRENNIKDTDFKVVIAPSAGNKIKTWGEKNFAEVSDEIFKKYPNIKIFLIGGIKDKKEIDGVISYLNPVTKVINTYGLFPLDELKAFIAKANLLIAVDTGPIYIAEAFGVATIDIVGPIDEREQPPIGEFYRIVKLENRTPQLYVMNARVYDKKEARRQIESITPKMVIEEFDKLVSTLKAKDLLKI